MPRYFEYWLELVSIYNDACITVLSDLAETRPNSHSDLDFIQIDIDNLGCNPCSFVQLYLCHNIGDLSLEVLWSLTYNSKCMNLAKPLELVRLQYSFSSASWTDWSRRKEECITCLAVITFNVVYGPNSSPDLCYSMCCHSLSTSLGCGQSKLPLFLQY